MTGETPVKGVFNDRALILNIPYSKLDTISEIVSPILSEEDRFSISQFKEQLQVEIVAPDKVNKLVEILSESNINLENVKVEPVFVAESDKVQGFIEGLGSNGAFLTQIAYNTGPALILPQNRTGIYDKSHFDFTFRFMIGHDVVF